MRTKTKLLRRYGRLALLSSLWLLLARVYLICWLDSKARHYLWKSKMVADRHRKDN